MRKIAVLVVALLAVGCDGGEPRAVKQRGGTVRLVIDPSVPEAGSVPNHILVNETKDRIVYGRRFGLEQRTGDKWSDLQNGCLFTDERLSLDPGESSSPDPITCRGEDPPLQSGVYRLTKEIDVLGDEGLDVETLVVAFKVI